MRVRTVVSLVMCLIIVTFLPSTITAAPRETPPPTTPLITRAIADDVGPWGQYVAVISYVAQVAKGSTEDVALSRVGKAPQQLRLWISGEEVADSEITSDTAVDVDGLVLIDVGVPVD